MEKYRAAKKIWNDLTLASRKNMLIKMARNSIFAHRSYPYIPKEVRDDLQRQLLHANPIPQPSVKPHWTEAY